MNEWIKPLNKLGRIPGPSYNSTLYKSICHKRPFKESFSNLNFFFFKRDPVFIYFMEIYCSKQESPELSKHFTSKGPSQDEEAKKELAAHEDGGKCLIIFGQRDQVSC